MRLARYFVAGVVLVALSGCGDGDDQRGDPEPTPSSVSPTPSTPVSDPPWMAKYTKAQLDAYEDAILRWQQYEHRAAPIWKAGKATPEAERLFRTYFIGWRRPMSLLELYAQNDVQVVGVPEVLWSRPTKVSLAQDGDTVIVKQCVDFSTVTVTQGGEPQDHATADDPIVRTVNLARAPKAAARWLIVQFDADEKNPKCAG